MTHQPNYVADRLAPYAFESVFNAVRCRTNLRLATVTPDEATEAYFNLFPEEKDPIWGVRFL